MGIIHKCIACITLFFAGVLYGGLVICIIIIGGTLSVILGIMDLIKRTIKELAIK